MTKLNSEQVRAIRAEWKPGTTDQLGAKYAVSISTITAIVKRDTWKGLPDKSPKRG